MGLGKILSPLFTWWNGATIGTRFHTWRKGLFVGEDEQGNAYYQTRDGKRRWVIYNGEAEASRVPPGWRAWLHRRAAAPPSREEYAPRSWEKPHRPNLTGTPAAHRPPGSLLRPGAPAAPPAPVEAWRPAPERENDRNGE